MPVEFFCAYHSYLEMMSALTDAEKGRLFTACLEYSKLGEVPQLSGNERFLFPAFKAQIDRDMEKYREKCNTNREKAVKRWHTEESPGMRLHTTESSGMPQHTTASNSMFGNASGAKAKAKANENAKEKRPSSTPPMSGSHRKSYDIDEVEALSHFDIPDEL